MSSNGEKTRLNGSINTKMTKNDVTTGFASEMFVVVLFTSSKAATVIMANAKNYLTNHKRRWCFSGSYPIDSQFPPFYLNLPSIISFQSTLWVFSTESG